MNSMKHARAALAAALAAAVLTTIPARGAPWTPADLPGQAALWLDASDGGTITLNGSTVSQWNDKSPNGRNATQTTATAQPTYTAGGLNGMSVLTLDGTDDYMSIASKFLDSANRIIIAVAKENSGGYGGIITAKTSSDTSIALDINSSRIYEYFAGGSVWVNSTSSGASWSIVAGQTYTNVHTISMNGTVQGSVNSVASISDTASTTAIGKYRTGDSNYGAFDLGELIVTTINTDTLYRQKLEGYLAWKWGLQASLPAGHPYKSAAPEVNLPTILSLSPADGDTNVPIGANLALTFDQSIASSGNAADSEKPPTSADYHGRWVEGAGDPVVLEAIDAAFESMQPSSRMACLPLLYKRDWDGFVEGPPWPCWWIQNSFGPSYAMMPFLGEPYATWIEHSQGLWFRLMGDGQRKDFNGFPGPDGCLCDAAFVMMNGGSANGFGDFRCSGGAVGQQIDGKIHSQGIWYRQGDGNPKQHDWFIGATAAGLILESDRLLIRHDAEAARKRLPQLERVAAFLDSRRDPEKNLLKGAMAANLLAPAYSGVRQSDGTYGQAYLTEISVNHVAGLERLAEVCILSGEPDKSKHYREIAAKVRAALPRMLTPDGCFIMSEDPDGTRHGVYGAARHGYFEATPNHDAGCFGVTDDEANRNIITRMLSLKGQAAPGSLAPHGLIIPNYPGYDDSVHGGPYGHWVSGGHWTTTQARMNIACLRAGEFAHPFGAWDRIRSLMEGYRADAPLTGFGATPWGDKLAAPYCVVYDCWGAPGGILRGLFEYDYRAGSLRVRPHLPAAVTRYVQKFPVWFGKTKIYLTVTGAGGCGWTELRPGGEAGTLAVELVRGNAKPQGAWQPPAGTPPVFSLDPKSWTRHSQAWPPPASGNNNPLRAGDSPDGGHAFNGEIRKLWIYRRPLAETEIATLAKGGTVNGAMLSHPPGNDVPPQFVARRNGKFWEYPPGLDIDFQEDFTLAAEIIPTALGDNARLVDRATIGTMNGYLLDYLNNGKTLRLLTPWGVAQGPVKLEPGKSQHVAATCSLEGLMRVYLDGVKIAETQGTKPAPVAKPADHPEVDMAKTAAFYQALAKAGLLDSYEASQARTALELFTAGKTRMNTQPPLPDLGRIPPCQPKAVETLYFNTATFIAGGLQDRLAGRGLWQEPVPREIIDIARREKFIP